MNLVRKIKRRRNTLMILLALIFLIVMHFREPRKKNKLRKSKDKNRREASWPTSEVHKLEYGFDQYPPRYRPPYDYHTVGQGFNVARDILGRLGMPLKDFIDVDDSNVRRFVVATAASKEYLPYALDAIGTVQYFLPKQPIIFYDLGGLSPLDIEKVGQLCSVTYKKFDATKFGSGVWDKRGYAWKPVIVHEVLKEYLGVLWIDSSVRINKGNLTQVFSDIIKSKGSLMLTSTGHSIYSATHPQMYQYLPSDISKMQVVDQHEAGGVFFYRTKEIYENIVRWWVLCALDKKCIAPTKQLNCGDIYEGGRSNFANCHRFDQSALNILLANHYGFNDRKYFTTDPVSSVKRFHMGRSLLNVCKFGKKDKWMHVKTYFKELFPDKI